jgi:protein transport protein SEC61 subunit beta
MSEGAQGARDVGGARSGLARRPGRGSAAGRGRAADGAAPMQQFQADSPSLKISPTMVLVLSLAFMLSVVALHILGKFKQTVSGGRSDL